MNDGDGDILHCSAVTHHRRCKESKRVCTLHRKCLSDHRTPSEVPCTFTFPTSELLAVCNHFCKLSNWTIWQSHPLVTATGQVCQGEKAGRILTRLSLFVQTRAKPEIPCVNKFVSSAPWRWGTEKCRFQRTSERRRGSERNGDE